MVFARVTWFGAAGLVKSSEFGQYRLILNKHEAKQFEPCILTSKLSHNGITSYKHSSMR